MYLPFERGQWICLVACHAHCHRYWISWKERRSDVHMWLVLAKRKHQPKSIQMHKCAYFSTCSLPCALAFSLSTWISRSEGIYLCFCPFLRRSSNLPYSLWYSPRMCSEWHLELDNAHTHARTDEDGEYTFGRNFSLYPSIHTNTNTNTNSDCVYKRAHSRIRWWLCDVVKIKNLWETSGKRTDETTKRLP